MKLTTMTITTLFCKLEEHEQKLIQLTRHVESSKMKDGDKEKDKDNKSIALKASSSRKL